MKTAEILMGREITENVSIDHYQLVVDGKLALYSRYGSRMAQLMHIDIAEAIARELSVRGITTTDYEVKDRQIVDTETGNRRKGLDPTGLEEDLTFEINSHLIRLSGHN
jgi:hypothetical protein